MLYLYKCVHKLLILFSRISPSPLNQFSATANHNVLTCSPHNISKIVAQMKKVEYGWFKRHNALHNHII